MAQPQFQGQQPVVVYQTPAPSGCGQGLGMGAGLVIGCIGVVLIGVVIAGVTCVGGTAAIVGAANEAAEQRRVEEAKPVFIVRWQFNDSVVQRTNFGAEDMGKLHVGVLIELENHRYPSLSIKPTQFRLEVDGVPFGKPFAVVYPKLELAILVNDAKARGALGFEVPSVNKDMKLVFVPEGAQQVTVRIEELK